MLLRIVSSQTPLLSPFSLHPNRTFPSPSHANSNLERRRWSLHAVEKESQFQIDREKAREALQKLDQQLQSLSQRTESPSKNKRDSSSPSPPYFDPSLERELMTGRRTEEMPEISGSYLAYSAVALVILTVFNNIVFGLFIKPSVEGVEPAPATVRREPLNAEMMKQAPPLMDQR
ncbi:uncharacterized protein LOC131221491 [Magnolia sinica]|uniref:uncharacterized protein LOC131221491 n=1 Tax=Magnolia sinica TaxID=86752 RepID=UPI00265B061B|nr:uncharacterized protein LOC131221491 [Magnolia sinica]